MLETYRHKSTQWTAAVPNEWSGTCMVLAHGAGQGMASPFMKFFLEALCSRQILTVEFDFMYMALKRKVPDRMPSLVEQYREILAQVRQRYTPTTLFIGGKSMGGRAASHTALEESEIRGLVFLGYPLHPPGKPDALRDAHLYDLLNAMLFASGSKDPFATPELMERVVQRLGPRATLRWIPGGDHSLKTGKTTTATWTEVADGIAAWLKEKTES